MSIIPSLRASTSRASSSQFIIHAHRHVRLSACAYATAVKAKPKASATASSLTPSLEEMDRLKEDMDFLQREKESKQRRYGNNVPSAVNLQEATLPLLEAITYKDFEKRWLWAGFGRGLRHHWNSAELATTPGFWAKITIFGRWGYRELGIAQSVPRAFWAFCRTVKERGQWALQWYQQHNASQAALDHCRREGLMIMTPADQRPTISLLEQIRRYFALGHVYRDWDPSMREFLNVYISYNQAIARGDVKTVEQTSVGKMRANGLKIAQSGAKMSWELVEEPALPKIRWARQVALPDQEGNPSNRQIIQICCSLDTVQRLHVKVKGQRPRETRVLDNVVYTFVTPEEPSGIVMRDRVGLDSPKHVLTGDELAKVEAKEAAHAQEINDIHKRHTEQARRARGFA